jgi:hypothetical protein
VIKQRIALATAVFSLTATSFAGPGLTTIRDVLYRVDGTPFEGSVTITWSSLNAGSASSIGMPVDTRIKHGKLNLRLVNHADWLTYYSVKYYSGKTGEFRETWAIPDRPTPLQLKDVRVQAARQPHSAVQPAAAQHAVQPEIATIAESSVINLVSDLAARPIEGAFFAPGLAAVIDSTGAIDGASGNLSDCVYVDGSSGPCGTASPTFVDQEVPAGTVNGLNRAFTTSATATPQTSLALYRNGILQKIGQDYTLSGNAITFGAASVPQVGDTLLASYRVAGP